MPIATGTDPQQHATVAWNGTRYFVAWSRNASSTVHIEGKRVTATAVPVEATAIPLSSSILELDPAVAARGTTFVVTWTEFRLETSSFDIRATRVNGDGTVPDADGFAIGDGAVHETAPAIVNGIGLAVRRVAGGRSCAPRGDRRPGHRGRRRDRPHGIVLSTQAPTHFEWDPAIAWNGSTFLVVWEDGRNGGLDIYGTRIDAGGAVLDAAGIPIATATDGQYAPLVASNGTAFLVVWEDFRSGSTYDIYGSRVNAAGAVLGSGTAISTAANDQTHVAAGFNGTDYVVAWQDTRSGPAHDIYESRVSSAGVVRDPAGKALSTATGAQITPSVASTSGTTLVVWSDARTGTADIRGTRVRDQRERPRPDRHRHLHRHRRADEPGRRLDQRHLPRGVAGPPQRHDPRRVRRAPERRGLGARTPTGIPISTAPATRTRRRSPSTGRSSSCGGTVGRGRPTTCSPPGSAPTGP